MTLLARLLAILLLVTPVAALAAAPTIDASGQTTTSQRAGATVSANVTTTSTNDSIVVVVQSVQSVAGATVTGIVGTGACSALSFTRKTGASIAGNSGAFSTAQIDMEVWTAPSSAALTACPLTVSLSDANQDVINVVTFGVNGLNSISSPFDSNALATACTSVATGQLTPPVQTTSQANDLLMSFGFSIDIVAPPTWTTSAWTFLYNFRNTTTGLTYNTDPAAAYKGVSATQSGATPDMAGPVSNPAPSVQCVVAFTADAAPASGVKQLLLMGVG